MRKLEYEIKNMKGFVLGVGYLKDKILKEINKNDFIEVDLLTNDYPLILNKSEKINKKNKKGKKISIKKIKKVFKRKRPNYIICNIDDVIGYLKYFIKDSLYITNYKIYVYSNSKKVKLDEIVKRYERYINTIEDYGEFFVINTTNYKNNIFKNIKYYVIDSLNAIYDFIGAIIAG